MSSQLALMAQMQMPLPGGIDWSRYAMGPAQQFFGNLTPPSAPPVETVSAATQDATQQIRSHGGSAGDQSGMGRGGAPGGSVDFGRMFDGYGSALGTAGSLLGVAGVPGASLAGNLIGTGIDMRNQNERLSPTGMSLGVGDYLSGVLNNATFGLLGTSLADAYARQIGTIEDPSLRAALLGAPPAPTMAPPSLVGQYAGIGANMGAAAAFSAAINDLNTVGQLGDVLDAAGVPGGLDRGGGGGGGEINTDPGGVDAEAGRGSEWRDGGPVGKRTSSAKTKPVRGTVHTGEWVHPPESRNAYGDKVMRAIQKREIPPKKLRALV